jgi:hypothetical protein
VSQIVLKMMLSSSKNISCSPKNPFTTQIVLTSVAVGVAVGVMDSEGVAVCDSVIVGVPTEKRDRKSKWCTYLSPT